MLMSLLPGLRDLRTPLAVGYVWLVLLWLLFEEHVPEADEATGVVASAYRLGQAVGPAGTLAAVSFVAYVIGTILAPLGQLWRLLDIVGRIGKQSPLQRSLIDDPRTHRDLLLFVREEWHRIESLPGFDADSARTMVEGMALRRRLHFEGLGRDDFMYRVFSLVRAELPSIVIKLQLYEKEQLFQSYDRNLSEAQFRWGISAPLLTLSQSTLLWQWPWCMGLLGTAVSTVLQVQGVTKAMESRRIAYQAVIEGIIKSTTISTLEQAFTPGAKQ